MRKMPWTACLWPGVAQFWSHGGWPGLVLALGTAALLDLLLVSSFGWSELIGKNLRNTLWVVLAAAWVLAIGWSVWERRRVDCGIDPRQDAFVEAREQYLKGDYSRSERLLGDLVRRRDRDLEARLLLATLLRRTGRTAEAIGQLDALARLDGAEKWSVEIEEERQLAAEATAPAANAA